MNQENRTNAEYFSQLNTRKSNKANINVVLENFKIIKKLGEGSFGEVKLVYDIMNKRHLAMKFINKNKMKNSLQLQKSRFEARLMSILDHPNICKLYITIETNDFLLLGLEYVEGQELYDYISKNKKVSTEKSKIIFKKIMEGIYYLHSHFIIHRDLKPENIMITEDGVVKIIDFGFATTFRLDEYCNSHCGSPFYASPEMIRSSKYIGPEVDIWSLGCILYVMVHGYFPFKGNEVNELYSNVLKGDFQINVNDQELIDLLKQMIDTDRNTRITTEKVLIHNWFNDVKTAHKYKNDVYNQITDQANKFLYSKNIYNSSEITESRKHKELKLNKLKYKNFQNLNDLFICKTSNYIHNSTTKMLEFEKKYEFKQTYSKTGSKINLQLTNSSRKFNSHSSEYKQLMNIITNDSYFQDKKIRNQNQYIYLKNKKYNIEEKNRKGMLQHCNFQNLDSYKLIDQQIVNESSVKKKIDLKNKYVHDKKCFYERFHLNVKSPKESKSKFYD
ncbi:CAMK/CAMKL protein kinase [Edhazardia aedis USNM 41457]|uniref:CAMK/CAMKL protein kinase n=1 Tax=Edhazardia aedis (strain USNM 41457) TaxID=1003232 RepID=J9DIU5_EDHAE|nr:CAMK/CAMKL protein kinase [Edhazardia aedis USNM 41457]|eukprot:EJW01297.1 CAMK/CAMKL protein kinase [Edhazardia aedis USNM 41457]